MFAAQTALTGITTSGVATVALRGALVGLFDRIPTFSRQLGNLATQLNGHQTPVVHYQTEMMVPLGSLPATFRDERGLQFRTTDAPQNVITALSQMRSSYPTEFWRHLTRMFPTLDPHTKPICVDVAVGADGRGALGALELASRGFHTIGIETNASHVARTFASAQQINANIELELMTAKVEHTLLHANSADLVTFLHGLHLVDTEAALKESWRILKPGGRLLAVWNDRDLACHFTRELEDIVEKHVPSYKRFQKQRSMEEWGEKLQAGGLFKLVEYARYSNPMTMSSSSALVDLLNSMSFIEGNLKGQAKVRFNEEVQALIERRYDHRAFTLPLETKMYVLTKVTEEERMPKKYHRTFKHPNGTMWTFD